jgi:hypothetical protein
VPDGEQATSAAPSANMRMIRLSMVGFTSLGDPGKTRDEPGGHLWGLPTLRNAGRRSCPRCDYGPLQAARSSEARAVRCSAGRSRRKAPTACDAPAMSRPSPALSVHGRGIARCAARSPMPSEGTDIDAERPSAHTTVLGW